VGRPVRVRTGGYASDQAALSHLRLALKSDARVPKSKLDKLVQLLDEVMDLLIEVDKGLKRRTA
jgi:hypothetical protein